MKLKALRGLRGLLEILVLLAIICMVVMFALTAGMLPPPPSLGGAPSLQKYGVGMLFLGMFLAGCGLIGLLFLLSRFQRLYRYPVEITPQNIEMQYILAKVVLAANQLVCALYTSLLLAGVYTGTTPIPSPGLAHLTLLAAALCGIFTTAYLIAATKHR